MSANDEYQEGSNAQYGEGGHDQYEERGNPIPIQKDEAPVEDPINPDTADSDEALG